MYHTVVKAFIAILSIIVRIAKDADLLRHLNRVAGVRDSAAMQRNLDLVS